MPKYIIVDTHIPNFRKVDKKMNINSIQYNSYLASIAQSQTINTQQTETQTDNKETDKDSYIPSMASADMVIPSGTYNAQGLEVGTGSNTKTSTEEASTSQGGAGAVGGGGSSEEDEEDTETEVVTINGVTYLQTTTTDADGNTTVTRTQIGSAPVDTK